MSNFKTAYSNYRRRVTNAFLKRNKKAFKDALMSNIIFFEISSKQDIPVSKKIYLYKNYKDIYDELYNKK